MHRLKLAVIGVMGLLFMGQALIAPPARAGDNSPLPDVTVAPTGELTLTWRPPGYTVRPQPVNGTPYSRIDIGALPLSSEPGRPRLPVYSALIGLPAERGATLRLLAVEYDTVPLPYPPAPAPLPQPVHLPLASPQTLSSGGPTDPLPDPAVYARNAFYPPTVARLDPPQLLRYRRLARLTINPVQVNPVTRQMKVLKSVRLQITFERPGSPSAAPAPAGPFDRALAGTLLNPQTARPPALPVQPGPPPISATTPLTRVVVTDSGLYALTYDDLAAAGLPVATLDPRTLQLSHGQTRRPVAVWVEGESDGRLDPGDRLLFYAPPHVSRYSDTDVYFLSRGQSAGRRMAVQPGSPAGLPPGTPRLAATAEENHFYDSLYPARDGDRWYWMQLRRPNLITATVPVSLSSPLPAGPDAALTLWLQGYTNPAPNPDHRLAVAVNGAPAGQIEWNGDRAITATFAVSAARLHNGQNNITLSLPGVSGVLVEGMWLDALALTYPGHRAGDAPVTFTAPAGPMAYSLGGWVANDLSVYNITDPEAPQIVTGFTLTPSGNAYTLTVGTAGDAPQTFLAVPGGQVKSPVALQAARLLQDPPGGADYIIITHADFAPAVAPLAQHRAAQGLRVTTVDVQAVYDTFGGGRVGPEAIKAFLQRAFYTWTPPAPLYVLLVGDGSYDFKNHSGWNSPTFIPPYLAEVDPWLGETAADNRYVTVAGNDPLPDMLIGRLPVNTPAEAETVVDKIIRYETNPLPGGWNARQLIVSDNPDGGGTFYTDADWVYNIVSGALESYRFYYTPQPDALPHLYNNVDALRQAFLADFNFGAGMVTFHGHSSWHQWGVEQFFRWNRDPALNDVLALQNGYRLPLVLEMTCFTGYFHHPEYPTLDESLLRRAGGGAVAVWGATGLGVSTGHGALQAGFYRAVINRQETNLGAAALAGKANLYAAGGNLDLLDTFTLFGDPALTLNFTAVPFTGHAYLPFAARH